MSWKNDLEENPLIPVSSTPTPPSAPPASPLPVRRPRIAITLGDPCGVGAELLLISLAAINRWADVIVVGSKAGPDLLEHQAVTGRKVYWHWEDHTSSRQPVSGETVYDLYTNASPDASPSQGGIAGQALWIDPTPEIVFQNLVLGEGSAASGKAAVEAVRTGARLVMTGQADALVTLPLSKAAAHQAGYNIPGHTEFLQELSGTEITRMAFVSPSLCVVLHTVHQSLRSVVEELSMDGVAETLSFSADRFIQLTGKNDLRVALCALNPHAGEGGAFGEEETLLSEAVVLAEASFMDFDLLGESTPFEHVASPFRPDSVPEGWAIFPSRARNSTQTLGQHSGLIPMISPTGHAGLEMEKVGKPGARPSRRPAPHFFGPLPADSLFHRASNGEFDLVVALYHDQGLIPIKVLEPKRAVNLTLGLPFIRTSPDHGTAFDKAGLWKADPSNFLEATALAVRLAARAQNETWKAEVAVTESLT